MPNVKHQVIGGVDSSDWMAPAVAKTSAMGYGDKVVFIKEGQVNDG